MVTDEEFEAELSLPELVQAYDAAARKMERTTRKEFQDNNDELKRLKLAALENELSHRDLLNLCAHPFTATGLGSKNFSLNFVRGSPLSELGVPNFDLLIARIVPQDKPVYLIPVEGKSSVGRPNQVVNDIVKKREVFKTHVNYVMERYLAQPPDRKYILEPVVAVDSVDAISVVNAVVAAAENILTWHGPTTGPETLSLAAPPKNTPDVNKYLHAEPKLNALLDKLPSVRRVFDVWPMTHPMIRLGALITASHPAESGMIVTTGFLDSVLKKDMFYFSDQERAEFEKSLLSLGVEIDFLVATTTQGEFRIVAKGLRREVLWRSLQEKWLKWQVDRDLVKEIETRKDELRKEFRAKRAAVRTMDDY